MSAKAGELAPSASRYLGNPRSRPGWSTAKNWRWAIAVFHGVVVSPSAWTTTRTRNASFSGRSGDVGSSAGVYTGGAAVTAARTAAMSTTASGRLLGPVPAPLAHVVHVSR